MSEGTSAAKGLTVIRIRRLGGGKDCMWEKEYLVYAFLKRGFQPFTHATQGFTQGAQRTQEVGGQW